jgi:hypothetical protein
MAPGGTNMTQLLELLAKSGPEKLFLYFGIPLAFATVEAASELYVLYKKETHGPTKSINTVTGWIAAGWFCWVSWQLFTTIWLKNDWRSPIDFISMTAYIGCIFPLLGMAVNDLPWVKIRKRPERRLLIHAGFSAMFTVLLFVSMITAMWNG